jgi:hypothetical protein
LLRSPAQNAGRLPHISLKNHWRYQMTGGWGLLRSPAQKAGTLLRNDMHRVVCGHQHSALGSHIAQKPLAIKDDEVEGVGDCFGRQHRTLERSLAMTCTGLSAVTSKERWNAPSHIAKKPLAIKDDDVEGVGDCFGRQHKTLERSLAMTCTGVSAITSTERWTAPSHIAQKPFAIPDDRGLGIASVASTERWNAPSHIAQKPFAIPDDKGVGDCFVRVSSKTIGVTR